MEQKINVGIIFGGKSGEHEVSLQSSYNVIKSIDKNKFVLTLIGISREGRWSIYGGDVEKIKDDTWFEDEANKWDFSFWKDEDFSCVDIFFPVLHGTFGEDGTIQGLFEILGKPYVGCGVLASSAAMDKCTAKILFQDAGIPVANGLTLRKREIVESTEKAVAGVESEFNYPVFVKPANMGSSVGISKAHNREELKAALIEAVKFDTKILVEEFVDAYEVEIAVLGNEAPETSCPGMIVPCHEFYDYDAKYLTGDDSKILIPAPISEETTQKVKEYAKKAFRALECSGLSRIDFFVRKDNNEVIINEVNTLPGFTNISMFSKLWGECGVEYSSLITDLIDLGFEHYNTRKELQFKK